ncbi:hypothetical protein [Flavobacterium commune]|uniref:Uncharacterized protein n=1 Tax=Flavobacterium commune TaxID=1306519 RepID=A0A1D9PAK0_9FLAO|nr:hypothetical protein [Flavobacterium commune]AOZ99596.1 hypothetical protein BIW12_09165 [Flavobacterium commune]
MKPKKSKLGSPAEVAIEKTVEVIPFLIKTAVFLGLGYWAYNKYTNRFVKRKENTSYPAANISLAQAQSRADAIYSSLGWVSNDFDNVSRQLTGLNYNGFVRVYNAFGHRRGTLLKGQLNLEEWCYDQFTDYQVQQLSFLLGGAFFQ